MKPCATATISGYTSDKKEELKAMGYRWHATRRNWFKFGEVSSLDAMRDEARAFWLKHEGEVLFSVFTNEIALKTRLSDVPF